MLRLVAIALTIALVAISLVVIDPYSAAIIAALGCAVLVTITVTDIERDRVPNWVVLPALLGTLAAQTLRDPSSEWLLAALSVAGLLLLVAVSPVGLGMGSVKLGALLGALLGWSALVAVGIACVAVAIHLAAKLARGARFGSTAVPVPRYLALGAVVVLLVHPLS